MIGIIDYEAGNITSVARALEYLGQDYFVRRDIPTLNQASHIIFPGVGAAGAAMAHLREIGLDRWLADYVACGKPLLGICLGAQIILEWSEENQTPCLGLLSGEAKAFPTGLSHRGKLLKVPHMGWNQVHFTQRHPVFEGLPSGGEFYFVHSYFPVPAEERLICGLTDYGITFASALALDNLLAVQFHPEKSGPLGLKLLENFCRWDGSHAH